MKKFKIFKEEILKRMKAPSDIMSGVGKEEQTCKNCKFNNELYCTVGTHYAEKGINRICYEGELWEAFRSMTKYIRSKRK